MMSILELLRLTMRATFRIIVAFIDSLLGLIGAIMEIVHR